ncbi:activating signal cointegrator 1 complex subunit 1-like [Cylas formicarius]|uniref:activating signal cointegrator 1 complex subunit 1-like n=1 Tax=Cylas formicarius TaxID=197179 RepID=UPI0029587095|nr:activating signal cointegrator 1 complex subunit 1-like [Cylas formicarius]
MSRSSKNQFPDFFTMKEAIPINVTPLKFGKRPYWMATVATESSSSSDYRDRPSLRPYTDNDDEMIDCADLDDNYEITVNKAGHFTTSFHVPSSFFSFIIGTRGSTLQSLQRSTNTVIKIPRINEKCDVVITGDTERKVASARNQIAMMVSQKKDRLPPTHFVGIRIESDEITKNFLQFQECVLKDPDRGVTKSVFQLPVKFHLTLIVMTVLDEEELELTKKCLENFYNEVVTKTFSKDRRLQVTVKGLEIMNDDPSYVNVLYANIEMESLELRNTLQAMCDKMLNDFHRAGLAKKQYDRVKLHLTLMNTSFKQPEEGREKFDASGILDKYGHYYFGKAELKEIQLCVRGTTTSERGDRKFYDSVLTLPL